MKLTRDAILVAADLPLAEVEVPEWGGSVYVRPLTGVERDQFEGSLFVGEAHNRRLDQANIRARLVALAACDETGARLFGPEDAALLGAKNAAALDRLYTVARRVSGLDPADMEAARKN